MGSGAHYFGRQEGFAEARDRIRELEASLAAVTEERDQAMEGGATLVIELARLKLERDEVRARLARAEEALAFYADEANWRWTPDGRVIPTTKDHGKLARAALVARGEPEETGRPLSRREIVEVWHDVLMEEAGE